MAAHPGLSRRPRFDIGDIVRAHRGALEGSHVLGVAERRVLSAVAQCRTAALGGFLDRCCSCGLEHPAYNSCRNRHCPKCQALAQEEWIAERARRLLPVRHFHVVFTLPAQLRALCRFASRPMYSALLQAAARTVIELAASRWRAVPGVTAVLHTWTRELLLHPHAHLLVTAGGLAVTGERWVSRKRYLLPIAMMQKVFRAKMLEALRLMRAEGVFDGFDAFEDPEAFDRLLAAVAKLDWVVYTKEPFHRAEHVLRYLEFLRRFLLHVLPDGFHKIRHYGLYASTNAETRWVVARDLLLPTATADAAVPQEGEQATWAERLLALTGRDVRRCRRCGGQIERLPLPRAPPAGG